MSITPNSRKNYIEIASRKFADDGFHGTSLASLAKEAGVTKQALLHFFQTKDRLYAEVLEAFAERQSKQIDAVKTSNPIDHLHRYFTTFVQRDQATITDTRLTVRALLESRPDARSWPLKPYLKKLTDLVRMTPVGKNMTDEAALAWVFQMIGSMQYFVISSIAIEQMFGKLALIETEKNFQKLVEGRISELEPTPY